MQNDHNSKAPCKDHRTRSIWNTFSTLTIRRMNVFGESALRKTMGHSSKRAARCRCRRASTRLLRDLPCCDSLPAAKNKNTDFLATSLRLRTLFHPLKGETGCRTADYLRFCDAIRGQGKLNNPQSQKSCNPSRFSVFSLPATTSERCRGRGNLESALRDDLEAAKVLRCGMTRARHKFDTAG